MDWNDYGSGRHKIHPGYPGASDLSDALFFTASDDPGLSLFEDSDTDTEGSDDSGHQMDHLLAEVGVSGSQDALAKPIIEQGRHLSFLAPQKRRAGQKTLKAVQLDDFEDGAQRWAAGTLIAAVQRFFEVVEDPLAPDDVVRWIFGKENSAVSFDNCCLVNGARPDVLRMRIQYELWRKGVQSARDLPICEDHIPSYIEQRAFFSTGMAGVTVAKILWSKPGIANSELKELLDSRQRNALNILADQYIASPIETAPFRWYATGINPILQQLDESDRSGSVTYRAERRRRLNMSWASRFEDL